MNEIETRTNKTTLKELVKKTSGRIEIEGMILTTPYVLSGSYENFHHSLKLSVIIKPNIKDIDLTEIVLYGEKLDLLKEDYNIGDFIRVKGNFFFQGNPEQTKGFYPTILTIIPSEIVRINTKNIGLGLDKKEISPLGIDELKNKFFIEMENDLFKEAVLIQQANMNDPANHFNILIAGLNDSLNNFIKEYNKVFGRSVRWDNSTFNFINHPILNYKILIPPGYLSAKDSLLVVDDLLKKSEDAINELCRIVIDKELVYRKAGYSINIPFETSVLATTGVFDDILQKDIFRLIKNKFDVFLPNMGFEWFNNKRSIKDDEKNIELQKYISKARTYNPKLTISSDVISREIEHQKMFKKVRFDSSFELKVDLQKILKAAAGYARLRFSDEIKIEDIRRAVKLIISFF